MVFYFWYIMLGASADVWFVVVVGFAQRKIEVRSLRANAAKMPPTDTCGLRATDPGGLLLDSQKKQPKLEIEKLSTRVHIPLVVKSRLFTGTCEVPGFRLKKLQFAGRKLLVAF